MMMISVVNSDLMCLEAQTDSHEKASISCTSSCS